METCKDCIHNEICKKLTSPSEFIKLNAIADDCNMYGDRSLHIELPCKVGDTVYFIKSAFSFLPAPKAERVRKIEIVEYDTIFKTENRAFNESAIAIGKTVFLTREEAEKALEERIK